MVFANNRLQIPTRQIFSLNAPPTLTPPRAPWFIYAEKASLKLRPF